MFGANAESLSRRSDSEFVVDSNSVPFSFDFEFEPPHEREKEFSIELSPMPIPNQRGQVALLGQSVSLINTRPHSITFYGSAPVL